MKKGFQNVRGRDGMGVSPMRTETHGRDAHAIRAARAFTLIEVMVVVALIAIVAAIGVPVIYRGLAKEPMRRTVNGLQEAFREARANAILTGKQTTVMINPGDRTFSAQGVTTTQRSDVKTSGTIPDSVLVEMIDINLMNYMDADAAPVRFFPNGTCDEFTMVLHDAKGDWTKLTLEPTTGIMTAGDVNR